MAKTKQRGPFLGGAILFTIGLSMAIRAYSDDIPAAEPREPIILCAEEDGSGPSQQFPCYWDGGSNQKGTRYILNEATNPDSILDINIDKQGEISFP